jgi:hypothetical protein
MPKLKPHPGTQSEPKNRRGTKSWHENMEFSNSFIDSRGEKKLHYSRDAVLASPRMFKKIIKALDANMLHRFNGRIQRKVAHDVWCSNMSDEATTF